MSTTHLINKESSVPSVHIHPASSELSKKTGFSTVSYQTCYAVCGEQQMIKNAMKEKHDQKKFQMVFMMFRITTILDFFCHLVC
jgi:hypothetical protein